jgi:hypothetical protein
MRLTGKLEIHDTASLVRYAIRRGRSAPDPHPGPPRAAGPPTPAIYIKG